MDWYHYLLIAFGLLVGFIIIKTLTFKDKTDYKKQRSHGQMTV